jgi:hypothetical protein
MKPDLDVTDPTFGVDLAKSDRQKVLVAKYLRTQKVMVHLEPTRLRPSAAERAGWSDEGDIWALAKYEVKHRPKLHFTSRHDYPYDTVFIDSVAGFERKNPPPFCYWIVNAEETHALVVYLSSFPRWKRRITYNKVHGREQMVYEADPKDAYAVKFGALNFTAEDMETWKNDWEDDWKVVMPEKEKRR